MPRPNDNKPWVSNYPPLAKWLEDNHARCMWQLASPTKPDDADEDWEPQSYVECHLVNARPVIVIVHANRQGWNVFSALDTADIAKSLTDLEARVRVGNGSALRESVIGLAESALKIFEGKTDAASLNIKALARGVRTLLG